MLRPSTVWTDAPPDVKLKLQWFQFPKGLLFDGQEFETIEVCSLFKVKELFLSTKSSEVDVSNIRRNQNSKKPYAAMNRFSINRKFATNQEIEEYWGMIKNQIQILSDILKKSVD